MKRATALVFAAVLAMALMCGLAEDRGGTGAAGDVVTISGEAHRWTFSNGHVVDIPGDVYRVVTPEGIRLEYTAPEGSMAFTQDLSQELSAFEYFFQDPPATINEWIEKSLHMNIFDYGNNVDIYVHVLDSLLASMYPDSDSMDDDDAVFVLNFMEGGENYFLGADSATCGYIGGQNNRIWFMGDMRRQDGRVKMFTFAGGKEILAYARIDDWDAQYECLLDHMSRLSVGVE